MVVNKVAINPQILDWALRDSQISIQEIELKFKKIHQWMSGEEQPTFVQLKTLSKQLRVPFGYMFLKVPPNPENFKKEFRTINNKINKELSKNLKDVLIDMEFKKNWMSDYRVSQGWEQIQFKLDISEDSNPVKIAYELNKLLNLQKDWVFNQKKTEDSFNHLRERIEKLGIIVMISGIVGQNSNRVLNVKEFRAVALMDKYAPLIFINRNDSQTGMIFSLVHEFIHLLIDHDDIITAEQQQTEIEQKINNFVAEFLIPSEYINENWIPTIDPIKQINRIANNFKISPSVVAIKLNSLNLINNDVVEQIFVLMNSNLKQRASSGGNYYNTLSSRLSDSFAKAVINQTESGGIRYTDAYRLLGINGKTYHNFKEHKEIQEINYGK